MTKTATAGWYRELVAGHAVVSVKEALAVAPGCRRRASSRCGTTVLTSMASAGPTRGGHTTDPPGPRPRGLDPRDRLGCDDQASEGRTVVNLARMMGALKALELSEQPELAALVEAVHSQ